MDTCAVCRSELAPDWNFCVHCGTAVPIPTALGVTAASATATDPAGGELEPIPSAIRPEPTLNPDPTRRVGARLVFGIAMATVGLLVVVYAVISLLGAHA